MESHETAQDPARSDSQAGLPHRELGAVLFATSTRIPAALGAGPIGRRRLPCIPCFPGRRWHAGAFPALPGRGVAVVVGRLRARIGTLTVSSSAQRKAVARAGGIPAAIAEEVLAALSALLVYACCGSLGPVAPSATMGQSQAMLLTPKTLAQEQLRMALRIVRKRADDLETVPLVNAGA
jgi:hypothetical protein